MLLHPWVTKSVSEGGARRAPSLVVAAAAAAAGRHLLLAADTRRGTPSLVAAAVTAAGRHSSLAADTRHGTPSLRRAPFYTKPYQLVPQCQFLATHIRVAQSRINPHLATSPSEILHYPAPASITRHHPAQPCAIGICR